MAEPHEPGWDAVLLVSFGGPEGPDEVMPFLEAVTRGREVPRERLLEVAAHYQRFGGVSPLNAETRALAAAVRAELAARGPSLPVYWGNRHWRPWLADALREMARDGVRRALAFVTAAYGSYPSCRQYREALEDAAAAVGPAAPVVAKLRLYYNHPGFIEAVAARTEAARASLPPAARERAHLVFTAHSIPRTLAETSAYAAQLAEAAGLVGERLGSPPWSLAYQSRSGPPHATWLEPDVNDHLRALAARGVGAVVLVPIGFVADHMEVVYDLDVEAAATAAGLGLAFVRARTVGTHPAFVGMVRELILERVADAPRRALGRLGPAPDDCPPGCCPPPGGRRGG